MFGPIAALELSLLGYTMTRTGFPMAPAMLGFILGPMVESNLNRVVLSSKGDMIAYLLAKPIFLILMVAAIAPIFVKGLQIIIKNRKKDRLPCQALYRHATLVLLVSV